MQQNNGAYPVGEAENSGQLFFPKHVFFLLISNEHKKTKLGHLEGVRCQQLDCTFEVPIPQKKFSLDFPGTLLFSASEA